MHRVRHRHRPLSKQVVLTRVHVLRLEFGVSPNDWRLLCLVRLRAHHRLNQPSVVDLRRPVLHHVLMHRQNHWITDRRNRLLIEAHILWREVRKAQLGVYAPQVQICLLLVVCLNKVIEVLIMLRQVNDDSGDIITAVEVLAGFIDDAAADKAQIMALRQLNLAQLMELLSQSLLVVHSHQTIRA